MPFDIALPSPLNIIIAGKELLVRTVREAAWLLAERWPDPACRWFLAALKACASALERRSDPARASLAFIQAALSAGFLVKV